MFHKYSPSS